MLELSPYTGWRKTSNSERRPYPQRLKPSSAQTITARLNPCPSFDSLFPQPLRCCPNWPTENLIWTGVKKQRHSYRRFHVSIEGFSGAYCVAGNEWCSCMTRHWPAILRKPIVSRNSSGSPFPFGSMLTHLPMAVAKSNLLSAGELHLVKVKGYRFLHRGK